MRFLLICVIVVLIAGCGGNESSMINLDDTTSLDNQLVEEFNKQMSMTWEPDLKPITRFDEETRILYWCLRGDYDLSGEVNVSDLAPVAQYFNQVVDVEINPSLVEIAPWWVDGDNNGQINISDVTPIAQNFQQRAFWWKTSIGWGQPLGGYGGLFHCLVPEEVDYADMTLEISNVPPPQVETFLYQDVPLTVNIHYQIDDDNNVICSAFASGTYSGVFRFEWDLVETMYEGSWIKSPVPPYDDVFALDISTMSHSTSALEGQLDVGAVYSQIMYQIADTRLSSHSYYLQSRIRVRVYDAHDNYQGGMSYPVVSFLPVK